MGARGAAAGDLEIAEGAIRIAGALPVRALE